MTENKISIRYPLKVAIEVLKKRIICAACSDNEFPFSLY